MHKTYTRIREGETALQGREWHRFARVLVAWIGPSELQVRVDFCDAGERNRIRQRIEDDER